MLERIDPEIVVVSEAEDGETAFESALKTKPDILFVDIRMPFLNGLELIEKLVNILIDSIIIIITGHDEFEYARKAVSLQVFEYLLKPVQEEDLINTLSKAKDTLSLKRKKDRYLNWAAQHIQEQKTVFIAQFLIDWLSGDLSDTEIADSTQFLGISLPVNPIILGIRLEGKINSYEKLQKGYTLVLFYSVLSILKEYFGKDSLCAIDKRDTIIALLELPMQNLKALLPTIETAIEETTHQNALIAWAQPSPGHGGRGHTLQEAYEKVLADLNKKSRFQPFVLLALKYIDKNYLYPELSLEEVAQEIEISPGYLSKLLKQATGHSFVEYLNRVRIQHALQLMENPAMKMYEIAEKVGYRSQHYFSRIFKQILGISPMDYKNGGLKQE